jgi:hypothetical protein
VDGADPFGLWDWGRFGDSIVDSLESIGGTYYDLFSGDWSNIKNRYEDGPMGQSETLGAAYEYGTKGAVGLAAAMIVTAGAIKIYTVVSVGWITQFVARSGSQHWAARVGDKVYHLMVPTIGTTRLEAMVRVWGSSGNRLLPFLVIWPSRMTGFQPWTNNCVVEALRIALRGMFYSEWIGLPIVGGAGAAGAGGLGYWWFFGSATGKRLPATSSDPTLSGDADKSTHAPTSRWNAPDRASPWCSE